MKLRSIFAALSAAACFGVLAAPGPAVAADGQPVRKMFQNGATSYCLDGDTGGKVYTNKCGADNPYQHWLVYNTNGLTMIQGERTGLCLTVEEDGWGSGVHLAAAACDSGKAQQHWEDWDPNADALLLVNNKYKKAINSQTCCNSRGVGLGNPQLGNLAYTWWVYRAWA